MTTTTRDRPHRTGEPPAVREIRAATRTRDLVELMERRPELAGVYRPADLAVEAISWSA